MPMINPYLSFNDECEAAFEFYRSIFGGEFAVMMRFKEMDCGMPVTPEEEQRILHVALPIGGNLLMGSDSPKSMQAVPGNNFSVSISAESLEEAKRLFEGLGKNGQVLMPLERAFWGADFGMLKDQFGVQWMVSYDPNKK